MFVSRLSSVVAASILALGAACAGPEAAPPRDLVLRDDFGDTVPTLAHPRRIVSLNPATTEILFTIGAGDRVVGRTHWDNWPPEAQRVPDLGDGIRPNVEAVLAARPDIVLLYASDDNRPAARRIRQAGIPTVAVRMDSLESFARVTRMLGRLTGDTVRAEQTVDSVGRTLARVRASTRNLPHPRVFLHAWNRPVIALGGGSFLTELVAIAGGRNIYDSVAAPSFQVSIEQVVKSDPDVILAGPEAVAQIRSQAAWQVVRAVREGRVLAYDTSIVFRPSVRLGEAAVSIAALLHPVRRP